MRKNPRIAHSNFTLMTNCLGRDDWEYEFVEEDFSSYSSVSKDAFNSNVLDIERNTSFENRPKSLHLMNGGESSENPPAYGLIVPDGDGRKKSVTFAQASPSPSNASSQVSPITPISTHPMSIPGKPSYSNLL